MSLKKKIFLSFFISSISIVILAAIAYSNFIEIMKEIRYLELSDTLRSKSLQLRRHEKNFFLYGDLKEIESVHAYIKEIKTILKEADHVYSWKTLLNNTGRLSDAEKFSTIEEYSTFMEKSRIPPEYNIPVTDKGALRSLEDVINEYALRFNRIEILFWDFKKEFNNIKPSYRKYSAFFPLIESTFLERPSVNAELIRNIFNLKTDSSAIKNLRRLDTEISALRKYGEEIITITKEFDKAARERVEKYINLSQKAALFLFPLFFIVGIGTLFFISQNMVKRLKILTRAIEKKGKGDFSPVTVLKKQDEISLMLSDFFKVKSDLLTEHDEVGSLINAFVKMNKDLAIRDNEIKKKNEELFQGKKLASIGTLASGVAHELNNPLNNIYLSAQILSKEVTGHGTCPPIIKETVKDIFSQTLRVKRIVSDLLEFARERTPELKEFNISSLIKKVLHQMSISGELSAVKYNFKTQDEISISADRHLLEQVFINLFSNAVDAMEGHGLLEVEIYSAWDQVQIIVSDTGKGIMQKDITRIFDPFFTTKEKGTGLGLAIVYNIIEKHKGMIEVKSVPEKGTVFTITLHR
jgi:two-component system, NtrC family, sensor kinase